MAIKKSQLVFVCNFSKNQRILMQFSLLDFKMDDTLSARAVLSADAGLLVITANMQSETGFPSSHQ